MLLYFRDQVFTFALRVGAFVHYKTLGAVLIKKMWISAPPEQNDLQINWTKIWHNW